MGIRRMILLSRCSELVADHREFGPLSGIVKPSPLESTTKTASRLAGSVSLAFSLIL
jgi:hypothetical protein